MPNKRIFITILFLLMFIGDVVANTAEVHISHFDERDGLIESHISSVLQDSEGFIWICGWNGLSVYDGYRFETFKGRPGDGSPLETNRLNSILELANHNILCRSNERYFVFDRKQKKFKPFPKREGDKRRRIKRIDPQLKKRVENLPQYKNIEISVLCQDRQGGLWVRSSRGLERVWFTKKKKVMPEKFGTKGEEPVRGLFQDKRGRVWIADKNGYVRILNSLDNGMPVLAARPLFLTPSGQLSAVPVAFGHSVYAFYEEPNGTLWLGTKPDGLFRLQPNGGGYKITHYINNKKDKWSISDNNVYSIAADNHGHLFVATFKGGLNVVIPKKDGSVRFVNANNILRQFPKEGFQSCCLLSLPDGTMLLGTIEGLISFRLNGPLQHMRFYINRRNPNEASSLSSNYIMGLLRTRHGEILIATCGGGVDKIASGDLLSDDLQFVHLSGTDGLMSDMTLALQEDKSGHVWAVSEASLSCIDIEKCESVSYLKGYFSGKFIFTEVPPLCLHDGRMMIGTTQGTLTFDVDDIAKSHFVPLLAVSCGTTLTVGADNNDIDITFAALDYNKEEDIVYAYRIEGLDSNWHYSTNNELHLVGLRPGTYKLKIRSTNGDGVWTNNEQTVSIFRKAKFTETPYFWILIGLISATVLFLVFKVVRYIRQLQDEIKNIRLTNNEKIAVIGDRVRDFLPFDENVEKIDANRDKGNLSEDERQFAERLKEFISDNIMNSELRVQDMSKALFVSRSVLFAKTKRVFGVSPNNLLLNMRIDRAQQLLMEGSPTIMEVAYQCGFSDPKYFSRCFRKITGKNPTEWKQDNANA